MTNNSSIEVYCSSLARGAVRACIPAALFMLVLLCVAGAQPRPLGEPVNLRDINTSSDEFAPAWSLTDTALYYNSTADGYSFFYTSKREDITRFDAGTRVHSALNKPRNNQSYIAFSGSGQVYLSSYRMTPRRPYMNLFQIFRQDNDSWSEQAPVEGLNEDGFSGHPAFSPSGTTLVFTSDRPGSFGGTDLWFASKQGNGLWEKPVNMGELLNSIGNEITPFFAAEDTLYFSSNGFGGKGGYEVFLTVRVAGVWQAPFPLVDVNTEYNESDYILISHNTALFASDRPGGKGGLDLYAIFPAPNPIAPPPVVEYSIGTQVQDIRIEEFSSTEEFPLLPYVFFAQNSSSLPSNLKALTAEEAAAFTEQSIEPEANAVYSHLLNIIGARMRSMPGTTLTLTGTADERTPNETAAIGRRRAEAVQDYLSRVWSIEKSRLPIVGRGLPTVQSNPTIEEGAAENRRVELQGDSRLLAPLRLGDVSTVITPQQLEAALEARPRSMVRSWRLIMAGESGSLVFADSGTTLPKNLVIPSSLLAPLHSMSNVVLRLTGLDSLGRAGMYERALSVQRIPIEQKRQLRLQDKSIERYSLLLFDYNLSRLNEEHKRLLRRIAPGITKDARVIVSGYTDAIGEEAYNAQLAEQRASAVADELRRNVPGINIIVEAVGESNLLDNNTPFGRFYSRTVQITIEKPLK